MSDARQSSHRQILRATSIIGGASALNILIGLVRVKVLAVLLGPTGVGLAGLYNTIMSTTATLANLGLGFSGVRQVAEASATGDSNALTVVRKTLWRTSLTLGTLGALLLWLLSESVSSWVFGDTDHAATVGWLGFGAWLSVISGSQVALLQGLSRISDLARAGILGAFVGSATAIGCVYLLGTDGVLYFVLVIPAINLLLAWIYVARLPRQDHGIAWHDSMRQLRVMLGLGIVYMGNSLIQSFVQLSVRSLVVRDIGLEGSGYYQAAWGISATSIGFILAAVGTNFYPRLTSMIQDRVEANRLVNEQAEVSLLLAAPIILILTACASVVIEIFYSPLFDEAAEILRWQLTGDLLKVASHPMVYILFARAQGRLCFLAELILSGSYFACVWFALPWVGLKATGMAYLAANLFYFLAVYILVHKVNAFRLSFRYILTLFTLIIVIGIIHGAVWFSLQTTSAVSLVLITGATFYSIYRLNQLGSIGNWLYSKLSRN